nr:MAG TPA: hypothetical protein [Caudoviricetes sp.]
MHLLRKYHIPMIIYYHFTNTIRSMRAGLLTEQIDILESSLIRNAYGEEET